MYKLVFNQMTQKIECVNKHEGNLLLSIPFDPANTGYQQFLKYQEEGGKVYGADEEVPNGQTPQ
jgi:hypothetical protein